MLLLRGTTQLLRVTTGAAGSILASVNIMFADASTPPVVQPIPSASGPLAAITSATTTTLASTSGLSSGQVYNCKNVALFNSSTTVPNPIVVQTYDGTNASTLWSGTLLPGEMVQMDENGDWLYYDATGVLKQPTSQNNPNNYSTTNQTPTAAVDVIVAGSAITIPATKFRIGSFLKWAVTMSKTGAGTVASTFTLRIGTTGTTSDTAVCTFSTGTGTAVIDNGTFYINALCRGPLTSSAIFQAVMTLIHNLATTGWSTTGVCVSSTSAAFDITQANLIASLSFNGGTALVATITQVETETLNL